MDYNSRHILIIGTITSYGLLYAQDSQKQIIGPSVAAHQPP